MKKLLIIFMVSLIILGCGSIAYGDSNDLDINVVVEEVDPIPIDTIDYTTVKLDCYTPIIILSKYGNITYKQGESVSRTHTAVNTWTDSYEAASEISAKLGISGTASVKVGIKNGINHQNTTSDKLVTNITDAIDTTFTNNIQNIPNNAVYIKKYMALIPRKHKVKYRVNATAYVKVSEYITVIDNGGYEGDEYDTRHIFKLVNGKTKIYPNNFEYMKAKNSGEINSNNTKVKDSASAKVSTETMTKAVELYGTQFLNKNGQLIAEQRSFAKADGTIEDLPIRLIGEVNREKDNIPFTNEQLYYLAPGGNRDTNWANGVGSFLESIKLKSHYDGSVLSSLLTAIAFNGDNEDTYSMTHQESITNEHAFTASTQHWHSLYAEFKQSFANFSEFSAKLTTTYKHGFTKYKADSTTTTISTGTIFHNVNSDKKPEGTCVMTYKYGTAPEKYTVKQRIFKEVEPGSWLTRWTEDELVRHVPIILTIFEDKNGNIIDPNANNILPVEDSTEIAR